MQAVLATLLAEHDLRLVGLSVALCLASSMTGMTLLHRARRTAGAARLGWVAVAAVTVGFGVWTTHFIGMLAFAMGMRIGYDIPLTLLSMLAAIVVTGAGLLWATVGNRRSDMALGGAIVGAGIAVMHYVGMSAVVIGGPILWNTPLVAASVLLGMALGSLGLWVGSRGGTTASRLAGCLVLTLAIGTLHFTGMGALGLQNCFPILTENAVRPIMLSVGVAGISLLIVLLSIGALYLDLRERRRGIRERFRMHALVDAAVEGLVIADGRRIVAANRSFLALSESESAALVGRSLGEFFSGDVLEAMAAPSFATETVLRREDGRLVPVEVITHDVDYDNRPHRVIAVRDLTERKRAEEDIDFLEHHDALTGLANRASLTQRLALELAEAARKRQSCAVLSVDLDRFKQINDQHGHAIGDLVLQRVAAAVRSVLGSHGCAARLGGDEFTLIVPDVRAPGCASRVAEDLALALAASNVSPSDGVSVSASIGIAIYPGDGETAELLLSNADAALNRAKQDGRGVFRHFEARMGAEVRERRRLEADLRRAVGRNQLRIVYQPQSSVRGGRVLGFEALARWDHPERGAVPPSVFIPIAEECGLIGEIDSWVLRSACAEAAQWENPLIIAVNVSAVQLEDDQLPAMVAAILLQTGLPAARLELEITETALMRDMQRALLNLNQIKAFGVRISMDDFGTGFSSLANLRAFPFDKIKIDRSFIAAVDSNEQSAAIVRAIVALGAALNLTVIAEGIERPEELEFLRRENCAEAQGYLVGTPRPIVEYADLVRRPHLAHVVALSDVRLAS